MSSLELSKEMLTVEGYLTDARLIVEKQLGKRLPEEAWAKSIIEIARMLQIEHQHKLHKKPDGSTPVPPRRLNSDSVMSSARKNPKLPPMVSADEDVPVQPKRSHTRKTPVEVKAPPRRVTRVREPKAEPKRKSSRRR